MLLISGKYGLRNHFWPLKSHFRMWKSEKKGPNSKEARWPIFKFFVGTREVIFPKMAPIHVKLFCQLWQLWHPHMGREYVSREKKLPMVNFLIFVQKNVSTIRFQEIKIRPFQDFEKKAFFSLFLMRKRLSSGQKWFLRPYFPLIRGMFLLKSGLRFSFWALEVPEPRVRKRPLSLTNMAFSSLLVRALPVPETKIKDHFSIETYP